MFNMLLVLYIYYTDVWAEKYALQILQSTLYTVQFTVYSICRGIVQIVFRVQCRGNLDEITV